jgi:hypothetical protein
MTCEWNYMDFTSANETVPQCVADEATTTASMADSGSDEVATKYWSMVYL